MQLLNVKAIVAAFDKEKVLVGAFSEHCGISRRSVVDSSTVSANSGVRCLVTRSCCRVLAVRRMENVFVITMGPVDCTNLCHPPPCLLGDPPNRFPKYISSKPDIIVYGAVGFYGVM